MLIVIARHLPVPLRRDHCLTALPLGRRDDRIAVLGLVKDVRLRLMSLDQGFALRDVGLLATAQDELDGIAQGIDERVNFGAQSATRSTDRLLAVFLRAPALC